MSLKNILNKIPGISKKIYEGDKVDLKLKREVSEEDAYDGIPTNYYGIYLHGSDTRIGNIDLRLKMNEDMYYYGHIGYDIFPKYRGHNYSYYACLIVFKIAQLEYDLNEIYITCNPDNVASYKRLNKLKGELVEVCQIPPGHDLYKKGDRLKCVFRYRIDINGSNK